MKIRLLSTGEIKRCINITDAIGVLEQTLIDLVSDGIELLPPTKLALGKKKASLYLMPVEMHHHQQLAIKFLSSLPKHIEHHQPQKISSMILIDSKTGMPKAFVDNRYLRQIRTGALSALATKLFSKPDAKTLALIGAGPQSFNQFEAIASVRPIEKVRIWSKSLDHALKLAREIPAGLNVSIPESLSDALFDADIISTIATSSKKVIMYKDLKPGVHINLISSPLSKYRALDDDVLEQAVVIVDLLDEALAKCKDLKRGIKQQIIQPQDLMCLGDYIIHPTGNLTERLTLFRPMGLAFADAALANYVYEKAIELKLGTVCDFD